MLQEHYEAVMRRTLERSQRVEQRQKRWSWGGLSTDSDGRTGRGPFFTLKVHPFLSAFLFNLTFIIHLPWCIKEPVRMHQKLLPSSKLDVKVAAMWSCFTSAGVKSSHKVHKSNSKLFFPATDDYTRWEYLSVWYRLIDSVSWPNHKTLKLVLLRMTLSKT